MLPRSVTGSERHTSERLTLDAVGRDDEVRVVRVSGLPRLIQRLAALGVVPGVLLTVVKPHTPFIVAIGGTRIAIGKTAAESVQVEVRG